MNWSNHKPIGLAGFMVWDWLNRFRTGFLHHWFFASLESDLRSVTGLTSPVGFFIQWERAWTHSRDRGSKFWVIFCVLGQGKLHFWALLFEIMLWPKDTTFCILISFYFQFDPCYMQLSPLCLISVFRLSPLCLLFADA